MTRSRLMQAAAVLFAAAWALVLARPVWNYYIIELRNTQLADKLIPFYPLLFLPLFFRRARKGDSLRPVLFAAMGAVGICLLGAYTGVQTLIWLGGIWLGLFALAAFGLRVSPGGILLFLLMPPVSAKTTLVLGFRLRLWLTEMAGTVLTMLDPAVQVLGNALVYQGRNFAVDPACEGLKMLTACALLVLILARDENSHARSSPASLRRVLFVLLIGCMTLGLWLFANLLRIIALVFADIGPDSPRHGIMGLVLFCLVVVFPMVAARKLPAFLRSLRESKPPPAAQPPTPLPRPACYGCVVFIMVLMAGLVWFMPRHVPAPYFPWPAKVADFGDFRPGTAREGKTTSSSEIAVYTRGPARLILKQGLNPLRVGHHPRRCWQGLGYKFTRENDWKLKGLGTVRMARIISPKKEGARAYNLIWWYQARAGGEIISSETEWRKRRLLRGATFTQVNIFAPAHMDVKTLIRRTAGARLLAPLSVAGP